MPQYRISKLELSKNLEDRTEILDTSDTFHLKKFFFRLSQSTLFKSKAKLFFPKLRKSLIDN
jgi:hypothetical protein